MNLGKYPANKVNDGSSSAWITTENWLCCQIFLSKIYGIFQLRLLLLNRPEKEFSPLVKMSLVVLIMPMHTAIS